jgi:hypothetical protein
MADKSFYQSFKENMDAMGLPCPESLFGTIGTASATIGTLASAVKTFGTTATLGEVLLTFPTGAAAAGVAAAVSEITLVIGALSASFYLGACIGSLIVASVETYGPYAYGKISGVLKKVAKSMNTSVTKLLENTMHAYPPASFMRGTSAFSIWW